MSSHSARASLAATPPFLITFSGIDGAGKTTQIDFLAKYLEQQGLRVLRLSFWDNIAVWSNMRAQAGYRAAEFCRTDPTSEGFTSKNHKHIRRWYLTAARSAFYLLDVVQLRRILTRKHLRNCDVVIFDRYIYDQIANIDSRSYAARLYRQLLLKQAPPPDLAFILDASPHVAFARKPEYPLKFMQQNRRNFLRLRRLVPQLITIPGAALEDVQNEILLHVRRSLIAHSRPSTGITEGAKENAVIRPQSSCRVQNEPTPNV